MTLIAEETLSKSAGDLLLAPVGTGVPADTDIEDLDVLAALGWVHVGWLDEEGPSFVGFEGTTTSQSGWNRVIPIRKITRIAEPMIETPLLQWNVENLQLYFPGATYDAGTRTLTVPESGNPVTQELLLVLQDGDRHMGIWVAAVTHRGGGAFAFPSDGDLAQIPVTFDVVSSGDPDEFVKFVGVDEAGAAIS